MRLLHVFSTFAVGGPQIRFCRIARSLGDRHHHLVVAMDGNFDAWSRLDGFRHVERLELGGALLPWPLSHFRLRKIIRGTKADRLITYNWGAIEWLAANHLPRICPHIHVEDGFRPDEAARLKRRRNWFRRLVFYGSKFRLLVPSLKLMSIAEAHWLPAGVHPILLRNGVDLGNYKRHTRSAARRLLGLPDDQLMVGTVATLRPEKNLARMIRAHARADTGAILLIVGDGPERQNLERIASAEASGSVRFTGALSDVAPALAAMDVYAVSSDTEQLPISLIEAMASSLPVAAVSVGDIALALSTENAARIGPEGDEESLTSQIRTLCSDANLRRLIGDANRRKAEVTFDERQMVGDFLKAVL